ncbi:hypothetical protein AB664_31740 [Brucella anthropi]|uniref:Uncharacterized protein n=1 Tax=Brucella anthropi TaxID=529 RepID=A0A656Z5A3_BRUAN|nr:hypothetical protein AB664_31740 [Brucella anthropi]
MDALGLCITRCTRQLQLSRRIDPAVDAMIEAMLAARERDDFVSAVRALDRILISGDYYIPLYYLPYQWVARWDRIGHPEKTSLYGYQLPTWWQASK